jgi:UDP-2-acetamido-3-amino-2,3-dideoxy-glucuronate N-acetyltransferase
MVPDYRDDVTGVVVWQALPRILRGAKLSGSAARGSRLGKLVLREEKLSESHFIHPLADVAAKRIGLRSRIWQFVVVLEGAEIGSDCNICAHSFIENRVVIGDRVTIKNGVHLWDGSRIEDDVFIGPNVTFTNDKFPVSRREFENPERTEILQGASIGGGAVILPGVSIGRYALVGAGSVVTSSVPDYSVVLGVPARQVGDSREPRFQEFLRGDKDPAGS